jgi:hypothetical protein
MDADAPPDARRMVHNMAMTTRTSNAAALLVLSLVLFNGYRLAPLLPNDDAKGLLVAVCTLAGVGCLIMGALRLARPGPTGRPPQ